MRRRRLTPLERRMRQRYTKAVRMGKTYGAELIVWDRIHHGFRVVDDVTRSEAAWYRDMLAIALARMITMEREETASQATQPDQPSFRLQQDTPSLSEKQPYISDKQTNPPAV